MKLSLMVLCVHQTKKNLEALNIAKALKKRIPIWKTRTK
jgi:molybdopterin synthase catalytic subunit